MTASSRARRRARLTTGVIAGTALAVAAPLAAAAHVHITPDTAEVGTTARLDFSFSHGCEDSPTTALVVDIPDGVQNVTPVADALWAIDVEIGEDGIPAQITYTATDPIPNRVYAAAAMNVILPSDPVEALAFPVLQVCDEGEIAWDQVADTGQDPHDLEAPAPVIDVVGAGALGGGGATGDHGSGDDHDHGDGDASTTDGAQTDGTDTDGADTAAAAGSGDDTAGIVALWLSGGALVAAVAALVVALVRRRA